MNFENHETCLVVIILCAYAVVTNSKSFEHVVTYDAHKPGNPHDAYNPTHKGKMMRTSLLRMHKMILRVWLKGLYAELCGVDSCINLFVTVKMPFTLPKIKCSMRGLNILTSSTILFVM